MKLTGKAVGKRLKVMYPAGLSFKRSKFPVLLLSVTHHATLDKFFPPPYFSSPASIVDLSACINYRHVMQWCPCLDG